LTVAAGFTVMIMCLAEQRFVSKGQKWWISPAMEVFMSTEV